MNTYFESYHSLGQGQEDLLAQAWGEFWHDIVVEACPPPDSALVLIKIRHALQCARIHRNGHTADQAESESALVQAIQTQTESVLQWCDGRGLVPPTEMRPLSQAAYPQEALQPKGYTLPESSIFEAPSRQA
jgi:hypothetical protein